MAKVNKILNLSGKVTKDVEPDVTITVCTNGFVVKVTGRADNDDWVSSSIVCNTFAEVQAVLERVGVMLNG